MSANDERIPEWNAKLVGKRVVKDEKDKDSDNVILESELPKPVRVLPPGAITTRDLRLDRLNVHTDENGIVQQVTFG